MQHLKGARIRTTLAININASEPLRKRKLTGSQKEPPESLEGDRSGERPETQSEEELAERLIGRRPREQANTRTHESTRHFRSFNWMRCAPCGVYVLFSRRMRDFSCSAPWVLFKLACRFRFRFRFRCRFFFRFNILHFIIKVYSMQLVLLPLSHFHQLLLITVD